MASTRDIFRKPNLPLPSNKRKIADPTSTSSYKSQTANKSAKLVNGDTPRHSSTNGSQKPIPTSTNVRATTVEDEEESQNLEVGPAPPSVDGFEEEEPDEDDEGRFFGSGVTKAEREVMDFIDANEGEEVIQEELYDAAWLRRTALSFQKIIDKNADMRVRYPDDPQKFVGSEADLDDAIKALSILAEHSELYGLFAKLKEGEGGAKDLVGLLSHENTDIAVRAVEVLSELTEESTGAGEEEWKSLVDAMIKAGILELVVQNFGRLDESNESDRDGIYHLLELVENLCSDPRNSARVGTEKGMLDWLVERIQNQDAEARGKVTQNRQYAAEILAILVQNEANNREAVVQMNGVDHLLQLLSLYRKKDPEKDSYEEEFVENLFDILTCLVDDLSGGDKFLDGEGIELCLIMLKEGKMSKSRSLRVLDHAMAGKNGVVVCEKFVETGLGALFGRFMKSQKAGREMVEHFVGIFASLLRYLPGESLPRLRLLSKFAENGYEKIERLGEIRKEYSQRVVRVETDIQVEKESLSPEEAEEIQDEWLSRRLDAGLFTLQALNVILAWLIAEDPGAETKISQMLEEDGDGLRTISASLRDQLDGIDAEDGQDGFSTREMLEALLICVEPT